MRAFLAVLFFLTNFQLVFSHDKPKLIVVISIDQMKYDYLQTFNKFYSNGGFSRLSKDGVNFTNCNIKYAGTVTCVGHATVSTGALPSEHGIVGNTWFEEQLNKNNPCTESVEMNVTSIDRSSINLKLTTLGDELKKRYPKSKVISISIKDYVAIMLGGNNSDGTYWYDYDTGLFTTSNFYKHKLPDWLERFNQKKPAEKYFNSTWERSLPEDKYLFKDSSLYEATPQGLPNTFPKKLFGSDSTKITKSYYSTFPFAPQSTSVLLNLAIEAIENENFGRDNHPDILWIGISNPDFVGHAFGPMSQEIQDVMIKTDSLLAIFLNGLDKRIGKKNYLVVLTADHGVAPIPEEISYKFDAKRFDSKSFVMNLNNFLEGEFGKPTDSLSYVLRCLDPHLFLNKKLLKEKNISVEQIYNTSKRFINKQYPEMVHFYLSSEVNQNHKFDDDRKFFKNINYNSRSGDILIGLKPFHIFHGGKVGTTHGSIYDYDTHIPLIFYGMNLKHKVIDAECSNSDIAITLASVLKIKLSGKRSGSNLMKLFHSD
ncbi:MAG: alkaline phosphatase family protein [Ignavibacteria bacterium]|nr:alkaline phosphatase family protein [Ignavibacteria bacterium]